MTLAKRVVPSMLCRGRALVKGEQFKSWRSIGHVAQAMQVHGRRAVDEAILLDIAATAEGRGPDLEMVREITGEFWVPLTVGGGVRSLEDINALLRAGADRVAICTGAFENRRLIRDASDHFGRQAIVAVVEYSQQLTTRCGTELHLWPPLEWARWLESEGAGEILLQSVDRDGVMCGYDLDLIRAVSSAVSIPVIASGGCSSYMDMHEAFIAGADACAAGALFCFSDETPKGAAKWLKTKGWEVRL